MADTSSIASRMEKLAKLKRMKAGLSGDTGSSESDSAIEPEVSVPEVPSADVSPAEDIQSVSLDATPSPTVETDIDDLAPQLGGADMDFLDAASDGLDETAVDAAEDIDPAIALPADTAAEEASTSADAENKEDSDSLNAYFEALGIAPDEENSATEADNSAEREPAGEDAHSTALSAADLGIDEDAMGALDDIVSLAGMGELADAEPENSTPDFTMAEIDDDILNREFEHESSDDTKADAPKAETVDGLASVTFDESRTTLLNHVSRQMNCSVEDVVVTALDWYLDALFGEDGEAQATG